MAAEERLQTFIQILTIQNALHFKSALMGNLPYHRPHTQSAKSVLYHLECHSVECIPPSPLYPGPHKNLVGPPQFINHPTNQLTDNLLGGGKSAYMNLSQNQDLDYIMGIPQILNIFNMLNCTDACTFYENQCINLMT